MNGSEPPSSSTTFFRCGRRLGDRGACALRAGHRDALHARIGDDAGDLVVGGEDVHVGALGEPGVEIDLLQRLGRLGALGGVLEQHRVADDQVGAGEPGDLVGGEVPRHDPQQHAQRAAPDDRRALTGEQRDRLVLQQLGRVVGVVAVDVGAEVHLAEGLVDGLAHLAHDDRGKLLAALAVQLADAADDRGPLARRRRPDHPRCASSAARSPPAARRP